jgi:hypothetical protein
MNARVAHVLRCPDCATELLPRGRYEALQIASCGGCGKVVDLALPRCESSLVASVAPVRPLAPPTPSAPRPARRRVALPAEMKVEEAAGEVKVTWLRDQAQRLTPVVNTTLGALYGLYVVLDAIGTTPFGLGLLAVIGGGWAYVAAASIFNRVRVRASHGALDVEVGPLPWFGARRLAAGEVRQVFTEVRQVPDKNGRAAGRRYVVSAVVGRERRRVELVQDLTDPEQARWLEETLERALLLPDVPVGGELEAPPPLRRR